jgi:hypothetical protein
MAEHEKEDPKGLTRRDLLKRGAVAGAVAWSAPVILSLRAPAFAQGTPPIRSCCQCVTGGETNEPCESDGFTCESCIRFCVGKGGVLKYAVGEGCSCILGVCRGFEDLPCEQQPCG